MVRAAVSGAIDYTGADPRNRQWRIRHRLLLSEVERQEDYNLLTTAHRHWLAFLSHGNLTEDSFKNVQSKSNELLTDIKNAVFPWLKSATTEEKPENVTLDSDTQELIKRYRQMQKNANRG
jgi:hypothetical protein